MLYLFHGTDYYSLSAALKSFKQLLDCSFLNSCIYSGMEQIDALRLEIRTIPFGEDFRVIIWNELDLKNFDSIKDIVDRVKNKENTILLVSLETPDKRTKSFKYLKQNADEVKEFQSESLTNRVDRIAEAEHLVLEPGVSNQISEELGDVSSWYLATELRKLSALYDSLDFQSLQYFFSECSSFYRFIDGVIFFNQKTAMSELEFLFRSNVSSLKIISIFIAEVHKYLSLKLGFPVKGSSKYKSKLTNKLSTWTIKDLYSLLDLSLEIFLYIQNSSDTQSELRSFVDDVFIYFKNDK